jgi:hypothetical protein
MERRKEGGRDRERTWNSLLGWIPGARRLNTSLAKLVC